MRCIIVSLLLVPATCFVVRPAVTSRSLVSLQAQIGLFFGTSTGSTEEVADLIAQEFGPSVCTEPIEIDSIQENVGEEFAKHDALIVGTPTWNTGADTERSGTGWDEIYYGVMQDLDLAGKKVAVFGLGDSVSYSENYADASGELHDVFESLGATMMGYTSQEGYEHDTSKAIRGDLFCGLLLDAVNQEELTEGRVKKWVAQLKEEGILEGGSGSAAAPAVEATVAEPVPAVEPVMQTGAINGISTDVVIATLEEENARLRKLLEENSNLLDENISVHAAGDGGSFTPHFNPKTQRTMWTSSDGRKCYFTDNTPKMTSATP